MLLDHDALVAPLKYMANAPMAAVKGLRIDLVQATHSDDQIGLWGFEQQVVVVVHETPGIAAPALLVDLLGKERDEALAFPVIGEDGSRALPRAVM